MIGAKVTSLPTQFAIAIATKYDLYVPEDEQMGNEELWYDLRERLTNFQKMAISTDFETSMVAYYEFEISEAQIEQLMFIHANTKKWLFGHIGEQLLGRLENSRTDGKEAKEMAEIILENFTKDSSGSSTNKNKKSLLVRFANIPEKDLENEENESE